MTIRRRALLRAAGGALFAGAVAGCGGGDGDGPGSRALTNPFHPFHFSVEALPPAEQVALLQELGYTGIAYLGPVEGIDGYLAQPAVRDGRFRLSVAGVTPVVFDAPDPFDRGLMDRVCRGLAGTGAALWFLVGSATRPFGPPPDAAGDAQAAAAVRDLAGIAAAHGVTAVIYPHDGVYVATAEHALSILRLTGLDVPGGNLKLALHLCHELRAGNGGRMAEVTRAVLPYVAVASLCGAGTQVNPRASGDWSDVIRVLDEGDYDVEGLFLRPLARAGYEGPIVLHTFGVAGDPRVTLTRSQRAWQAMASRAGRA